MIPVPPVGYGGIERIVDALVREYRCQGHTVGLLAHPASTAPADARFGWSSPHVRGFAATWRNALALRHTVTQFRPDVIHSFSRLAYLTPVLPRTPAVMSYQRHTGGRQIRWAARVARNHLRFTGCSEFISRMGRRAGGVWTTVPNFVEPERFRCVPDVPADAPLVFLSRIEDIKGPDLAIAIARAAGRRLILAGNRSEHGPQRKYFEEKIQPWLGRDGIEWIGEIDDRRKDALLGTAAALLVPIQWDEPFGIVFVEALACGTPVITCPRGAAPEIVTHGENGFLVHSAAEGVRALSELASISRVRCRASVESRFSARAVAAAYLTVLSGPES